MKTPPCEPKLFSLLFVCLARNPRGRSANFWKIKTHPYVAQQNELRRRVQSLAAELGLSPVARLRAAQAAGGDTAREGIGGFLGRK